MKLTIAKGSWDYLTTPFALFVAFFITGVFSENLNLYAISLIFLGSGIFMI